MTFSTSKKVALKYKLLLILLVLALHAVHAQDVFSVGPAFHYNFGDKKPKVSWGVEASLWWFEDYKVPFSANLGFDRRKGNTILYTQAQTGLGIVGISAGPYIEFKKDEATAIGLQTDYWVNYYMGLNYRIRYAKGGPQKALGIYLKAPIMLDPEEDDGDDSDWDWD
ncbi:hypothetical protein H8S95_17905 [Pontibacter sp. KCTC 32443]|uniref:hypothetical protein n=1 Tax=Pontibacter TaxID=323449 RepID=UPI00164E9E91|nr:MULTISPECIES: hypothetical protein [Pontibacter]MBC5775955.1 hypothetical protein [Pontibacter sp. KCTC 32443]